MLACLPVCSLACLLVCLLAAARRFRSSLVRWFACLLRVPAPVGGFASSLVRVCCLPAVCACVLALWRSAFSFAGCLLPVCLPFVRSFVGVFVPVFVCFCRLLVWRPCSLVRLCACLCLWLSLTVLFHSSSTPPASRHSTVSWVSED